MVFGRPLQELNVLFVIRSAAVTCVVSGSEACVALAKSLFHCVEYSDFSVIGLLKAYVLRRADRDSTLALQLW